MKMVLVSFMSGCLFVVILLDLLLAFSATGHDILLGHLSWMDWGHAIRMAPILPWEAASEGDVWGPCSIHCLLDWENSRTQSCVFCSTFTWNSWESMSRNLEFSILLATNLLEIWRSSFRFKSISGLMHQLNKGTQIETHSR